MRRLLLVDVLLKYVGKFHTSILIEKKWDCVPRRRSGTLCHECQIPGFKAGLAPAERRGKAACAAGAAVASTGPALHPQRHDLSGTGAVVARALRQRRRARTSAIIARWLAAPEFTDAKGEPLPLPRTAEGDAPSFEQLVESITKDVRPRAVLDEWLDRKLVTINGDDEIVLIDTGFVPRGDDDRKWHYLGRNLHDHVAAAAENVSCPAPRFLERAVHYDGLSPKLAKRLEARSRELAMEALKVANREANRALAKDKGGHSRWNFGVYVFHEDLDGAPDDGSEGGPS